MTRISLILIQALKSLKSLTLIDPFCAKYITFDLKICRGVKSHEKFEEKLTCGLKNVKIGTFMGFFCPK